MRCHAFRYEIEAIGGEGFARGIEQAELAPDFDEHGPGMAKLPLVETDQGERRGGVSFERNGVDRPPDTRTQRDGLGMGEFLFHELYRFFAALLREPDFAFDFDRGSQRSEPFLFFFLNLATQLGGKCRSLVVLAQHLCPACQPTDGVEVLCVHAGLFLVILNERFAAGEIAC